MKQIKLFSVPAQKEPKIPKKMSVCNVRLSGQILAWNQAPHWGKKEKKSALAKKNIYIYWRAKRAER